VTGVALLTIGAFARAAGLSTKALRLYDELGLLRPAAVDRDSGYRFYQPTQLEQARLIAWLRRIGMPLHRIHLVCSLDRPAAAAEVAAYWSEVRTEVAARDRMAAFLVDHLSGRTTTMPDTAAPLRIRFAARTDPGRDRTTNEDVAYAGANLLAVADGMRAAGGERASAVAVAAVRALESRTIAPGELLGAMAEAMTAADRAVAEVADQTGTGEAVTTLTALYWSGSELALAHIGDTRAYRLRDGELRQITHDHTYVQSLLDEGKLSPAEARSHPQRALLVRALTGSGGYAADVSLHDLRAGDRYLLCSDGLSAVVADDALQATLATAADPQQVVDDLVALAYAGGAPDNIACVVADVLAG
jgi:PPM family protein phosphatase